MSWRRVSVTLLILVALTRPASAQTATLGVSFNGTSSSQSGFYPPDTQGAVGPNHYVEMVNGRYQVFSKEGGSPLQNTTLNQFWASSGYQISGNTFDPRVQYDRPSGRWFAAAADGADSSGSGILLAVSNTADPTGSWSKFRFDAETAGENRWADFPTLGISKNWVTVSTNMFPINTGSVRVSVLTIPKSSLVAGNMSGMQYSYPLTTSTHGFTLHPATEYEGTSDTGYALSAYNKPGGLLRLTTITGALDTPALSAQSTLSVTGRGAPPNAPQSGTSTTLATGDTRFSSNPWIINGKMWAVHGVSAGGLAQIEWYRINPATNAVEASGLLPTPAGLYVMYPSIAVNPSGDIVVGFSGSNGSMFGSAYAIAGRFDGTNVNWGTAIQTMAGSATNTTGRFGDYSATTLDPADPGAFWTSQEFVPSSNAWRTRITEVIPTVAGEIRWKTAGAGAFGTAGNWQTGTAPLNTDHVIFSRWSASSYAVDMTGGASNERLSVRQTGTGTVSFNIPSGNVWTLTNTSAATPSFVVSEFQGTSNVTITGGGTLSTRYAQIGGATGGSAVVTVSGATWNNANDASLGSPAGPGGPARLDIRSNGTVAIGGALGIYQGDGSTIQVSVGASGAPASLLVGGLFGGSGVNPRVDLGDANSTLTVTDGLGTTYAGRITGPGQLIKQGNGTFALTGNNNTYSGGTTINGGTLAANSSVASSATGSGSVTVNDGGALRGQGAISGAVTVNPGGMIRGGSAANPTTPLTVNNTVTLNGAAANGGALGVDLNGVTNSGDTVGTLALSSGVLNFQTTGTGSGPVVIWLLNGSGLQWNQPYTFTIASGAAGGFQLNGSAVSSYTFGTDYTVSSPSFAGVTDVTLVVDGSNNLVMTFTPVPEPRTVLGIGVLALGVFGFVRRRYSRKPYAASRASCADRSGCAGRRERGIHV